MKSGRNRDSIRKKEENLLMPKPLYNRGVWSTVLILDGRFYVKEKRYKMKEVKGKEEQECMCHVCVCQILSLQQSTKRAIVCVCVRRCLD